MPALYWNQFLGEAPNDQSVRQGGAGASLAIDADVSDGRLRPRPCPKEVCALPTKTKSFIFDPCCGCVNWNFCADPVDACGACGTWFYLTSAGAVRQATPEMLCERESCPVYLQCPTQQIQVSQSCSVSGCDCGSKEVLYTYTYVNIFGQESAPAPVSSTRGCEPGSAPANLSLQCPIIQEDCVAEIRIYRYLKPFTDGVNDPQDIGSFHYVDSVPFNSGGTCSYTDSVPSGKLQEELTTWQDNPIERTGYCGLEYTDFNELVLFKGSEIYITRPGRPNALAYGEGEMTLDLGSKIIDVIAWNQGLVALTEDYPFFLQRNFDQAQGASYYPVRARSPIKGISKRSICAGDQGVYMTSEEGLVVVAGDQSGVTWGVVNTMFTSRQWNDLKPRTAIGAFHNGEYLVSNGANSYRIPVTDGTRLESNRGLTRTSYQPINFWKSEDGCLYFQDKDGKIYEEKRNDTLCDECCPFVYQTEDFWFPSRINLASAKVRLDEGSVTFELIRKDCQNPEVVARKEISDCEYFHLPRKFTATRYCIRLTGCGVVRDMAIGTSAMAIGRVNANEGI